MVVIQPRGKVGSVADCRGAERAPAGESARAKRALNELKLANIREAIRRWLV